MKKFELRMGIAMLTITTIINVILLLTIQLDLINVFIILGISAIGYSASDAYMKSYIDRTKDHYYGKGWHDAKKAPVQDEYDNNDYNGVF